MKYDELRAIAGRVRGIGRNVRVGDTFNAPNHLGKIQAIASSAGIKD